MRVQEYLPICDEEGSVIGLASRGVVHAQGLLHQAIHILIVNSSGEIFLQLRGPNKDTYPGHWDSSVSGHVDVGETPEQAAQRELLEEAGLTGDLTLLGKHPASHETSWEFVTVFTLHTDEPCRWNSGEIAEGRCLSPSEIERHITLGDIPFTPNFKKTFQLWSRSRVGAPA